MRSGLQWSLRTTARATSGWRPVEYFSHQARGEDIAFLQYTSGSTGDPKGVTLTHANLLANIRSIVEGLGIVPDDVAISWLPLYHDMGLIGAWFVTLFSGNPVVIMSPLAFLSRPERWLRAIHRHRGTVSPAPNFAYELCARKIADKDLEGLDLSSWRGALNGAEPVQPAHARSVCSALRSLRFPSRGLSSSIWARGGIARRVRSPNGIRAHRRSNRTRGFRDGGTGHPGRIRRRSSARIRRRRKAAAEYRSARDHGRRARCGRANRGAALVSQSVCDERLLPECGGHRSGDARGRMA